MKQILLFLLMVSAVACTKEKHPAGLTGKWNLVETKAGTGYGFLTTSYSPGTEISIYFEAGGGLALSGANPGSAGSPLWEFTNYEILTDSRIRFYNTATSAEMFASYDCTGGLSLWYEWARCGYGERFIRWQ